ncbi:MAG: glycosyltransferase [Ignavibacteriales bacterium]|nr:glycosyltransferase [Ignavibacteriales bacterium]
MKTKIVDIDLSEVINPIFVEKRFEELLLVAMWKHKPLGKLVMEIPTNRAFDEDQIFEILAEDFGDKLWEEEISGRLRDINSTKLNELPGISVIVCSRDRAEWLRRCLESLKNLDYQKYEVVVVDNCTKDSSTFNVVKESGFRYVKESKPGLDWARNKGIEEANYNLVAFIDDDAIASKGWLNGIEKAFENEEIMAVTGLVLPAELETEAQSNFEIYGGMSKGFSGFTIRKENLNYKTRFWSSSWGVGANMAFRKILFNKIGLFDVALDVGTPTAGGGDIEFFQRVVSSGYILRYEPSALVKHFHRKDDISLKNQIFNNGKSFPAYLISVFKNIKQNRMNLVWFAFYSWFLRWLLFRLIKSNLTLDRKTFFFAFTEMRGTLGSLKAYYQSRLSTKKLVKVL